MEFLNDHTIGAAIGGIVAFLFAIPAILVEAIEHGRVKNIPLLVDVKTFLGKKLKPREVFLVALLIHVLGGVVFGFVYVVFVENAWLFVTGQAYTFLSLVLFSLGVWVINGMILFPSLGMGLFGRKEGSRVWVEMLVTSLLLALGMWVLVRFYQPVFFVN